MDVISVENRCTAKLEILDVQKDVTMMLANLALLMDKIVSQSYVCPDLMIYTYLAYLLKESSLKNPSPIRRLDK